MKRSDKFRELEPAQLDRVNGGRYEPGVYRSGTYQNEAKDFFRQCVGDAVYDRAMSSDAGRMHHYVVARAFLSQQDWEKFVWIEQFGSLEGFHTD